MSSSPMPISTISAARTISPTRTFYIQEHELSKWIWAMSLGRKFSWLTGAIDPADIMRDGRSAAPTARLVIVDGDRADVLPGIDVHAALDSHTWGCMYVSVRNDGQAESADSWVFAGDLVYCMENLRGRKEATASTYRSASPSAASSTC